MGALTNAVALMNDFTFRQYCQAASVYTATTVVSENTSTPNHTNRLKLAKKVLDNPEYLTGRLVSVMATMPDIAQLGITIGDDGAISEAAILAGAANCWDALSILDAS